jgi:hypothetical protein
MVLLSAASQASPDTVPAQHAALLRHSVAHESASDHSGERKDLVRGRKSLDRESVAGRSKAHQKLARQNVAGQSSGRRKISGESAAHRHAARAATVHKPSS